MEKNEQMNSGLARYRSAPSSYFANLISGTGYGGEDDVDQFLNTRGASPEADRFFSRFMSTCGAEESLSLDDVDVDVGKNSLLNEPVQSQFASPMKHEPDIFDPHQQHQHQQVIYHGQSQSDQKPVLLNLGMDNRYNVTNSTMDRLPQMKMGGIGGSNSNLIRQSSSPAGLFANINVDNATYAGMGNFGAGSDPNAQASFSSASRLKNQLDFPPAPPSISGTMPRAPEIGGKSLGVDSPESGSFVESQRNDGGYMTSNFPSTSWDDSALLSDSFLKDFGENDRKTFSNLNSSETQSGDGVTRTAPLLAHHLSLPTSSLELSAMDKMLQFQDSVPLKIRAKRGCATHPRSIAERVRRTKISERMRKLQELVPNMDKQTNTADMLDLAVDYIKDLQKEVTTLSDIRSKCTCSNNQQS